MQPTLDPAAMALLKKAEQKMLGLKTYRAECWGTLTPGQEPGKTQGPPRRILEIITAAKPAYLRYDQWSLIQKDGTWKRKREAPSVTFVCDGKNTWQQYDSTYNRKKGRDLDMGLGPWRGFYSVDSSSLTMVSQSRENGSLKEVRYEGRETVEGTDCERVVTRSKSGETVEIEITWYFSSEGLMRREIFKVIGESPLTTDSILRNIKVNIPIASHSKVFSYKPPPGVSLKQETPQTPELKLLPKGSKAPDFSAVDKDGKTIQLSDFRGKVLILNFWASEDVASVVAMAYNQMLMKELQNEKEDVVLLALDDSEDLATFLKSIKAFQEMDAILFAHNAPKASVSKSYKISRLPTQYVIDPQGNIEAGWIGGGAQFLGMRMAIWEAQKKKVK